HLGCARGTYRNYLRNDLCVKSRSRAPAGRIDAAHNFGNLRQSILLISRIFAFRRKGQIKISRSILRPFPPRNRTVQAALFENREHELLRGSWVSCALEN